MLAYLRIKIASLAAEAVIIRKAEQKFKKRRGEKSRDIFWGLRNHRTVDVRSEARSAIIASGFLRGTPYRKMEPRCRPKHDPDWKRVEQLVAKYGPSDAADVKVRLDAWRVVPAPAAQQKEAA